MQETGCMSALEKDGGGFLLDKLFLISHTEALGQGL